MTDRRRITLVTRDTKTPQRDWDFTNPAGSRIIFVDSIAFLPHAIFRALREEAYDVERVIIDRTGTALQFVEFLAMLPLEFAGDVIFIASDGTGFLSSRSRGDGRVLYAMTNGDLGFYLQTHSLTWAVASDERRDSQIALA